MSDTTYSAPFGRAAHIYRSAGWQGTLPLGNRPGRKYPPPNGFTGHGAPDPSGADVQAWLDAGAADRNIGLRLPPGVIGLDVDDYTKGTTRKTGGATIAAAEAKWGPLPPTWVSSARPAPSGIRFYRVPLTLDGAPINWPGELGPFVEIIQTGHRYAVVWPSTNPENDDALYEWWYEGEPMRFPDKALPRVGHLAALPEPWVRGLALPYGRTAKSDIAGSEVSEWIGQLRSGETQCPVVHKVCITAVDTIRTVEASRHETARDAAAAIMRLGGEGHRGAPEALTQLGSAFALAVGAERVTGGEWSRLLSGAVKLAATDNPVPRQHCADDPPPALTPYAAPAGVDLASFFLAGPPPATLETAGGRWVDITPFLDGTFEAPEPVVGAQRDDGRTLMYPGKWHSLIAPTETGKSLWAAWHVAAELRAGRTVIYAHFEESSPAGTIGRLLGMGVPKEVIRAGFRWADCSTRWQSGEFAAALALLPRPFADDAEPTGRPSLLILDGINAACGQHQWPVEKTDSVTAYRQMFVTPATVLGLAVLSLGHPPKAKGREDERHGFGSTAWLDEVDGVGFRLLPAKDRRIEKGKDGMVTLYVVKDRYGEVSGAGMYRETDAEGWRYLGAFCVDSRTPVTIMRLSVPREDDRPTEGDPVDRLGEAIVAVLKTADDWAYAGVRRLQDMLSAAKVTFDKGHVGPAIERLRLAGRLEVTTGARGAHGGRLTDAYTAGAQDTGISGQQNSAA